MLRHLKVWFLSMLFIAALAFALLYRADNYSTSKIDNLDVSPTWSVQHERNSLLMKRYGIDFIEVRFNNADFGPDTKEPGNAELHLRVRGACLSQFDCVQRTLAVQAGRGHSYPTNPNSELGTLRSSVRFNMGYCKRWHEVLRVAGTVVPLETHRLPASMCGWAARYPLVKGEYYHPQAVRAAIQVLSETVDQDRLSRVKQESKQWEGVRWPLWHADKDIAKSFELTKDFRD